MNTHAAPQGSTLLALGWFECVAYKNSPSGRTTSTTFRVHCNGIALNQNELLLLSVIGPETSVKAVTAALHSSEKDQQRIEYSVHAGEVQSSHTSKSPTGYQVHRAKLCYDLWHVLLLSRRPGFLPVRSDNALWQHFRSDQFSTPLLREWIPWLRNELVRHGKLIALTRTGCEAAVLETDSELLDELVSQGLRSRRLWLPDEPPHSKPTRRRFRPNSLDDYLTKFSPLLAQQAEQALAPLHRPQRDATPNLDLSRQPYEVQAHVIAAAKKALARQKSILIVGEMGTGKTLMGMAITHADAGSDPGETEVWAILMPVQS
ncbi:MAG: hypothetical protein U0791_09900 [Gemmataceae bacterium]